MSTLRVVCSIAGSFLKTAAKYLLKPFKMFNGVKSIRTKLILAFMVPIILIITLGILSYQNSKVTIIKITREFAESSIKKSSEYMNLIFSNIDSLTFQLFAEDDVQKFMKKNITDTLQKDAVTNFELSQSVDRKLSLISSSNRDIYSMLLVNSESKKTKSFNIYSLSNNVDLNRVKDMYFFKEAIAAKGNIVWMGRHEELDKLCGMSEDNYSISAVRLVQDLETSEVIGVIVFNLKPDFAKRILDNINLGKNEELHLISSDGRDITNMASGSQNADIASQDFYLSFINSESSSGYAENIVYNGNNYLITYSNEQNYKSIN